MASSGTNRHPRAWLKGKVAPTSIMLLWQTVGLIAVGFLYYVIAFFFAVQVVPLTMGFVKAGTGVTLDMPLETVLSAWIVPALFLVGLLFVAVLLVMRGIWRLRIRANAALSAFLFGTERAAKVEPMQATLRRTKTSAKAA